MNILNKLTLKHLKLNKRRTIVTIIGIILSTSLMVGIGLLLSTMRENMIDMVIAENGNRHMTIYDMNQNEYHKLTREKEIQKIELAEEIGYAELNNSIEYDYSYIKVIGADKNYLNTITLSEGRLPVNDKEIIIKRLNSNLNVKLGDTINLELGKIIPEEENIVDDLLEETPITFEKQETKTYQVLANVDWQVSSDATWLKVEKSIDGNITATSQSEIYFTTRKAVISLTPTDKTLGIEATTLEVRQAGGSYELNGTPGTIDEATGAITFTEETGNANCRYYINKPRKLAIHKWHFSNIEVDDNRCLNMNCVASPIPGWNFWLGVGANPWTFKYRGGSSNDDYKCTPFDLNKLKALKVSHTYSTPDNKTKAKIEVFIKLEGETDWTQIITTPEYENLFETTGSAGNFPYFGFIAGTAGKKGTMTITSYEVTNIE